MTDPGRLKTRLTIEAPVESDDGQGGVVRGYAVQQVVWAALTPQAARGDIAADAAGASQRVRILLRRGVALTLRHRLIDGANIYRIIAFGEIDDHRFVAIDAELRVE